MQSLPIGEQEFTRLRERNHIALNYREKSLVQALSKHMDELAVEAGITVKGDDYKTKLCTFFNTCVLFATALCQSLVFHRHTFISHQIAAPTNNPSVYAR